LLKAKLPETNSSQVKKGLPVTITTDSGAFGGTVERIGALALTDTTTYGTYLDLYVRPGKDAPTLRSGASASLTLNLGERSGVLLLKRGAWYAGSTQDYVYVVRGDQAVKTKVSLGSATTKQVEVVSGLKAGDQVITSSYQAIAAYDTVSLTGSTNK
jgi:HlyD family secretion protein